VTSTCSVANAGCGGHALVLALDSGNISRAYCIYSSTSSVSLAKHEASHSAEGLGKAEASHSHALGTACSTGLRDSPVWVLDAHFRELAFGNHPHAPRKDAVGHQPVAAAVAARRARRYFVQRGLPAHNQRLLQLLIFCTHLAHLCSARHLRQVQPADTEQ